MKKILVTGAGGYIGRHVVRTLLDMGHDVTAVDVNVPSVDERAKIITYDIFNSQKDCYDYFGRPDLLIHMAWRNGFVHNCDTHMGDLSGHFSFLKNMIDGGLSHLSVMGTMHEVGYHEGAIDENTPCNPQSQYGIAKNALRQALFQAIDGKNVTLQWLRAYYIYGDDLRNHSVFTKLVEAAELGKTEFPFTTGKNKYDFVSVGELAKMIAVASVQDRIDGIINVCSGQPVSLAEKMESFIKEKGFTIRLKYGAFPDRPYDSPAVWGDATKIQDIMQNCEE